MSRTFSKSKQFIIFWIIIKSNSWKEQNYDFQQLLLNAFDFKKTSRRCSFVLERKAKIYSDKTGIRVTDRDLGDNFKTLNLKRHINIIKRTLLAFSIEDEM